MLQMIDIIGVQTDRGAGTRGMDMGPAAIRSAGLLHAIEALGQTLGFSVYDLGDIRFSGRTPEKDSTNTRLKSMHYVNHVNKKLYMSVLDILGRGHFPVILGGDHSISAGSVTAVQRHYGNIGVIWMDAHGDYNNAVTSPSGNMHGMPLSAVTGFGPHEMIAFKEKDTDFVNPKNTVIIGARAIDDQEKKQLRLAGISVFTMADIDRLGIYDVAKRAIEIASTNTKGIHLSFDLDCLDPSVAVGVGTPAAGGMTYREAHLVCELLAESKKLLSLEVVELNPILDSLNKTGLIAVELIASMLGETIF